MSMNVRTPPSTSYTTSTTTTTTTTTTQSPASTKANLTDRVKGPLDYDKGQWHDTLGV